MSKYIEITPQVKDRIEASLGEEVDASNFVVYEARAISTEPISKNKGFFAGAKVNQSTLAEMASFVNSEGTVVPLHVMHNDSVLPVGRLFYSEVLPMHNGEAELRAQFYIPKDEGVKSNLIADIESSLISEVSVGLLTEHAYCSECNFDFFGPESDFMNMMTRTCNEDHVIGENGCHLRLVGLDTFSELSLVGKGAAKDAKIFSRAKARMSEETVSRLAASHLTAEACLLTESYKIDTKPKLNPKPTNEGESTMGLEVKLSEVSSELGEKKAELSQATAKIEGLNNDLDSLTAKLEEANAKIAELEAADAPEAEELKADKEAADKTIADASVKLSEHVKAALVASGDSETEIPEDLTSMLTLIESKGMKLHQIVGSEPKADASKKDVEEQGASFAEKRRKLNFKV